MKEALQLLSSTQLSQGCASHSWERRELWWQAATSNETQSKLKMGYFNFSGRNLDRTPQPYQISTSEQNECRNPLKAERGLMLALIGCASAASGSWSPHPAAAEIWSVSPRWERPFFTGLCGVTAPGEQRNSCSNAELQVGVGCPRQLTLLVA